MNITNRLYISILFLSFFNHIGVMRAIAIPLPSGITQAAKVGGGILLATVGLEILLKEKNCQPYQYVQYNIIEWDLENKAESSPIISYEWAESMRVANNYLCQERYLSSQEGALLLKNRLWSKPFEGCEKKGILGWYYKPVNFFGTWHYNVEVLYVNPYRSFSSLITPTLFLATGAYLAARGLDFIF